MGDTTRGRKRSRDEEDDGNDDCHTRVSGECALRVLSNVLKCTEQHGETTLSVRCTGDDRETRFSCCGMVLAASSPVFNEELYGPLASGERGRVVIVKDFQPRYVRLLLRFIHGATIHYSRAESAHVYMVADYYQVQELRAHCVAVWIQDLQISNCTEYATLANNVNCKELEDACIDRMTKHFTEAVLDQPLLYDLPGEVLAKLVTNDRIMCAQEGEIIGALLRWYCTGPSASGVCSSAAETRVSKRPALLAMLESVRWNHVPDPPKVLLSKVCKLIARHFDVDPVLTAPMFDHSLPWFDGMGFLFVDARGRKGEALDVVNDVVVGMIKPRIQGLCQSHGGAARVPPQRLYCWGKLLGKHKEFPDEGKVWPLHDLEFSVGRSTAANISLCRDPSHKCISRIHFILQAPVCHRWKDCLDHISANGVSLKDTSQNGTFVNGALVGRDNEVRLRYGDLIQMHSIGDEHPSFVFHPPSYELVGSTSEAGGVNP